MLASVSTRTSFQVAREVAEYHFISFQVAEEAAEKHRKSATHWKQKHDQFKILQGQAISPREKVAAGVFSMNGLI